MIIDYLKRQDVMVEKHKLFSYVCIPLLIFISVTSVMVITLDLSPEVLSFSVMLSALLSIIARMLFLSNSPVSSETISDVLRHFRNDQDVVDYFNAVIESGVVFKRKHKSHALFIGSENIRKAEKEDEHKEIAIKLNKIKSMLDTSKLNKDSNRAS